MRLVLILLALGGCATVTVEGDCTMSEEIKFTYVCTPDGKIEHIRIFRNLAP